MSKLNKFLIIFVLSFILIASNVLAADITNLNSTNENPAASQDMPSAEDRVSEDSENSEEDANAANDLLNGVVNSGADQPTEDTSAPKISSITQATSVPEANLRLSNILSFVLISIGVVLILLAIAILIKIKR